MATRPQNVQITAEVADILTGNVGATFTSDQIAAIYIPGRVTRHEGCIEKLYYGSGDDDLQFVIIDGKVVKPANIKDFRERLREAACCRHCISFCVDEEKQRMFMLNVWPCRECKPSQRCECP